MSMAAVLTLALVLDALLGEPRWLWDRVPHPAVVMGRAVGALEKMLNHGAARRWRGVGAVVVLVAGAFGAGSALALAGPLAEIVLGAILLAHRSLVDHVRDVARGLRASTEAGRRAVAMIVSRDTNAMEPPQIARSAIESAAENFSDGIVAPAFWFLIGGLPGLMIYKIVNTADSMIGYRTERYEAFGWTAARLDDLMNLVPARLTAVLITIVAGGAGQWRLIAADAALHRSPNAGWPEAAMARAINVALAGPRSYDGQMRDFPFVHDAGARDIGAADIERAIGVLWRAWGAGLGLVMVVALWCLLPLSVLG